MPCRAVSPSPLLRSSSVAVIRGGTLELHTTAQPPLAILISADLHQVLPTHVLLLPQLAPDLGICGSTMAGGALGVAHNCRQRDCRPTSAAACGRVSIGEVPALQQRRFPACLQDSGLMHMEQVQDQSLLIWIRLEDAGTC